MKVEILMLILLILSHGILIKINLPNFINKVEKKLNIEQEQRRKENEKY